MHVQLSCRRSEPGWAAAAGAVPALPCARYVPLSATARPSPAGHSLMQKRAEVVLAESQDVCLRDGCHGAALQAGSNGEHDGIQSG